MPSAVPQQNGVGGVYSTFPEDRQPHRAAGLTTSWLDSQAMQATSPQGCESESQRREG